VLIYNEIRGTRVMMGAMLQVTRVMNLCGRCIPHAVGDESHHDPILLENRLWARRKSLEDTTNHHEIT